MLDTGQRHPAAGPLLRRYRLLAALTQEELASAAGLSVRTVRNFESGRGAPQRHTAERLAEALGLDDAGRTHMLHATEPSPPQADPPAGLPPDLPDFVGREEAVGQLLRWAAPGSGAVTVVHGLPGVGKTALLVRAAHLIAARDAGPVLFMGLGGGAGDPVPAHHATGELLVALGIDAARVPAPIGERTALWRMVTADGSGLLALDDAADEAQVRPLLPVGPGWTTVVSSRAALRGLAAVHRLPLGVLPDEQARRLLVAVAGPGGVRQATDELVALCGGLPLALRLAGRRAGEERAPGAVVAELRDEQARLSLGGSGDVEIRGAFAVSYRGVGAPGRTVLRRLGLLPRMPVTADLAAALAGLDVADAADVLDVLADAGLLSAAGQPDRYTLHDLVRAFAAERAAAEEEPGAGDAALDRLERRLLASVHAAARWLEPHPDHDGSVPANVAAPPDPAAPDSPAAAVSWLYDQRDPWWWAIRRAAGGGRHEAVIQAARDLHWYSDRQPRTTPWHRLFGLAMLAARAIGDGHEEAVQLGARGWAWAAELGRDADAVADLTEAARRFADAGDDTNHAWMLWYLFLSHQRTGQYDAAVPHGTRAVELFRRAGNRHAVHTVSTGLAEVAAARGADDDAVERSTSVIAELAPVADRPGEHMCLCRAYLVLARVRLRAGRPQEAVGLARLAHEHAGHAANPLASIMALVLLGEACAGIDPARAADVLRGVLDVAVELHLPRYEAEARLLLGGLLTGAERAAQWHRAADVCAAAAGADTERLRERIRAALDGPPG